jgi:hypothetical protein
MNLLFSVSPIVSQVVKYMKIKGVAEREGFEPSVRLPLHTLSKRAPSATRTPLQLWQFNAACRRIPAHRPVDCMSQVGEPQVIRSPRTAKLIPYLSQGVFPRWIDGNCTSSPRIENFQDVQGSSAAAFSPAMRPKAIASGMLLPPG